MRTEVILQLTEEDSLCDPIICKESSAGLYSTAKHLFTPSLVPTAKRKWMANINLRSLFWLFSCS